jgi:hypothetical protein
MATKYINGIALPPMNVNRIIFTFDDGPRDLVGSYKGLQRDERYPPSAKQSPYETNNAIKYSSPDLTIAEALILRLAQYEAKASMFCVGWRLVAALTSVGGGTNWVKKWLDHGHDVCNHTYHHPKDWPSGMTGRSEDKIPVEFSQRMISSLEPNQMMFTLVEWGIQVSAVRLPGSTVPGMDPRMNDLVQGVPRHRLFVRTPHYDGMKDRPTTTQYVRPGANNGKLEKVLNETGSRYTNWKYLVSDRFLVGDDSDVTDPNDPEDLRKGMLKVIDAFKFGFNYLDTHEDGAHGAIVLLHERVHTILALNVILHELSNARQVAGDGWPTHGDYKVISLENALGLNGVPYEGGNIRKGFIPTMTPIL